MNNITNLTEYKVKKLTIDVLKYRPQQGTRKYSRLMRDIVDAAKLLEKNE